MKPPEGDDGELELEEPGDQRGRDVVELYELPPLFTKEGTDNAPTTRPIVWCYIWKKQGASMGFIDFVPVEDLDDVDKLRDSLGAGVYQVQGRGANKKDVVKQVTVTIGGVQRAEVLAHAPARAELDFTKLAAGAVAALTPLLSLYESMSEKREARERERRQEEQRLRDEAREREDKRNEVFMTTMTNLMGARNADLEALLKAQQAAGGVGSGGGNKVIDSYNAGQADTLELIRAIKEDGLAGEDLESRLVGLFEAFAVGKNKAKEEIAEAERSHANGKGQA